MDIYLSINNRQEILKIPVLPAEFKINKPWKNDVFDTVTLGELKLIGLAGLKTIAWDSFFPIRDYPFLRDRTYKAWQYNNKIDVWRNKRIPIRLIVTDTPINIPVVIDEFDYTIKTDGDLYYSISMSEFKFAQLK